MDLHSLNETLLSLMFDNLIVSNLLHMEAGGLSRTLTLIRGIVDSGKVTGGVWS